jgi:hypothetical protein
MILRYKDLTIKTQCKWNTKTEATPVMVGTTGNI